MARFGPATRAWFAAALGTPTAVQQRGWQQVADGAHTLMIAPTGSGKTLAAFLYSLDRLTTTPLADARGVRVLYISPLKALAHDIDRNLKAPLVGIGHAAQRLGLPSLPVRVDVRTGDTPSSERQRQRRRPGDILVTTPESLYLLLTSQARETLRTVEVVILDEIHVLAGTKRGVHLALSLERLSAITHAEPQRIGLSATQRPVSTAARFLGGDREVAVVDTSEPPRLDLRIVVPVEDMEAPPVASALLAEAAPQRADPFDDTEQEPPTYLPPVTGSSVPLQSGIWPSIHPVLLEAIRSHTSTIVFVNSRLLCERLTAALNDRAGEALVRAHHGSISHEQRARIEEDLKAGRIPAIVATSSLELGIDMGAVDLVVLVASPGSVARGLQRIGRAGHQVGATSEGRMFPKFRGDLLETAVVAQHMLTGDIEPTTMPALCLDVLAQQVVAIVAGGALTVGELHALVARAAPYRDLSREALDTVLDMLSGRYPSDELADLTPAISWDRAVDRLEPRKGTQLLAVLNAGTIPDRGLYRVKLGADGPRLGELDEEMVFESREGDVVILGATSWRITNITRDVVEVAPAPGQPGRLPFWRGEGPGRPVELGRAMGAFLGAMASMPPEEAEDWLVRTTPLDALAARNLAAYVAEQREATGTLPTDRAITVERFRDELGDWRVCILTPFGKRVHQPWALALEALLSVRAGVDVQAFATDDGVALRFADGDELPATDALFPEPEEVSELVVDQLRHSALFAARFREAAGRALLLPKRRGAGRTPLWLQRRKAGPLLAVAQRHPTFPIVLETYRECLQDVFDVPALVDLLGRVRRREIVVDDVESPVASPFARSLVFQYVAAYLYEGDSPLAERKAAALALDRNLLRELLGQEELRDLLDADAVAEVEEELARLPAAYHARHADGLHDLLRRLGDLTLDELSARCSEAPGAWLADLSARRQVLAVRLVGEERWIAVEDAARYRDALGVALPAGVPAAFTGPSTDPIEGLLRRWARSHGPFHAQDLAHRYGLAVGVVEALLRGLEARGVLVHGELRPGGTRREWCDAEVMRRLRRRSLARLRDEVAPVEPELYGRFLPAWHGLDRTRGGLSRLQEVVDQLEGVPIPFSVLEREILPARVRDYQPALLDQLGAFGQIVWVGRGALGTGDGRVSLHRRDRVHLLVPAPAELPDGPLHRAILGHLDQRGASFTVELQRAAGDASSRDLTQALWDLVWAGAITNDTLQPLRSLGQPRRGRDRRVAVAGGRWSSMAQVVGEAATPTERAHAQVSILLDRYGVLSREAVSAEEIPGGFTALYPVLKAMETAGRVRRGYFVDGFGGAQFALPGAVDRLRAHREIRSAPQVFAATDPAQAWGALQPWPPTAGTGRPRREAGARVVLVDGLPALWISRTGRHLVVFQRTWEEDDRLDAAITALRAATGRTMPIHKVDGVAATDHPQHARLVVAGLERDLQGLLLTRSR